MIFKDGEHFRGELRFQEIIIEESEEEFPPRLSDQELTVLVSGHGHFMAECAQSWIGVAGDHRWRGVGGAIVGDQNLYLRRGLRERTFNRPSHQISTIEGGNGDG